MTGISSHFWSSPGWNVEFALLAWVLLLLAGVHILSTSQSSPLRGWIVDSMVKWELSIHSKIGILTLTASRQKWSGNSAFLPNSSCFRYSWNCCLSVPHAPISIRLISASRGCVVVTLYMYIFKVSFRWLRWKRLINWWSNFPVSASCNRQNSTATKSPPTALNDEWNSLTWPFSATQNNLYP